MKTHPPFRALPSIALMSLALTAAAQHDAARGDDPGPSGHVEVGVGVSDGNGKLGEFGNGLDHSGMFPVGNVLLWAPGEATGSLFHVEGEGGLYGSRLDAGYSRPGEFGVSLVVRDSQKVEMGDVLTVVPGDAGGVFNLPADFAGVGDPDSYFRRDLVVDRTSARVTLERQFGAWLANLSVAREDRDGDRSIAGSQGFAGTSIVVEPVDYRHNEVSTGLDYSGEGFAVGVGYYLSNFDNRVQALNFQNPNFLAVGQSQLALAPSNDFRRLDLDGHVSLGVRTNLMWMLNWSSARQDEDFLPYAVGSGFYRGSFTPLPADSLDGEVERFNGRVSLVSRPTSRLSLKAALSLRHRDARHDPYLLDTLAGGGAVTNLGAQALTYGKDRDQLDLEAGYRFANGGRLRLGWTREEIDRDQERLTSGADGTLRVRGTDSTEEDRWWADFRISPVDALSLSVRLEHGDRGADISEERRSQLHTVTQGSQGNLLSSGAGALPFYLAARDQTLAGVHGSYMLSPSLALDGGVRLVEDDFDRSADGLDSRRSRIVDLGLSYSPSRHLALSLYGSHELFRFRQYGTTSGSGNVVSALWTARGEDESSIVGVNGQWHAVPGKLTVQGDISFTDNQSDLSSHNSLNGSADGLPGYGSEVVRLDINATWTVAPDTDLRVRYIYEDWRVSDFAWYDGDIIDSIAFGWAPYNLDGHGVILSVRQRF